MLLEAFSSRFAIGILGVNLSLGIDRVLAGALAGLLISLPDAFSLHPMSGFSGRRLLRRNRRMGRELPSTRNTGSLCWFTGSTFCCSG
jgi:hypothetical protein